MAMTEHPLTGKARLMRVEGRRNLKRVRAYVQDHPGAKQIDVAEALGLSVMAVNRHFKALRREWAPKGIKQ